MPAKGIRGKAQDFFFKIRRRIKKFTSKLGPVQIRRALCNALKLVGSWGDGKAGFRTPAGEIPITSVPNCLNKAGGHRTTFMVSSRLFEIPHLLLY